MTTLFGTLRFFVYFSVFIQLRATASVEEGWRYQDTFNFCIACNSIRTTIDESFLRSVHTPLAYTVDMAKKNYATTDLPTSDSRVFAAFRFTPVIQENPEVCFSLGKTVPISNAAIDFPEEVQLATGYECVFVSGFFKVGEEKTRLVPDILKYDAYYEGMTAKPEVFVRIPPLTLSPVPSTFIIRNYIDPEYLTRSLQFRYPDSITDSIFIQGDYSQIRAVHVETKQLLEERKRKIEEVLDTAKGLAGTTDISILLKPLKKLESDRRKVGNNARANSYNCAEQLGLDFISDIRVTSYLRRKTNVTDGKVVGVIVHLHTSETPCGGACATSLARECEPGGLFSRIFHGKPVKLINTASEHYRRPPQQIRYDDTRYKEILRPLGETPESIEFSLTSPRTPYPIILYGEEAPGNYQILREAYSMRPYLG